jgi:hypothetical protein
MVRQHKHRVRRAACTSLLAVTMASGVGVWAAVTVPAASANSASNVIPHGSRTWIAGTYSDQGPCNQAGARGVRAGKWNNYICYAQITPKPPVEIYWVLSVTKDD